MCSPSAPPAPDYVGAAQQQGESNLETARVQGRMGSPNIYGPSGSSVTTWEGDQPTITQTLSDQEQSIFDQDAANRFGMGGLAGQGINSLSGLIGHGVDFSGAPGSGSVYQPGQMPDVMDPNAFGDLNAQYANMNAKSPEVSEAIRNKVIEAMMSRGNADFAQREEQDKADLIARGLTPGGKGYEAEMDRLNRARTDYRMQAELTGGAEADRAFGQDMGRRQQEYSELMGNRGQLVGEQAQRFGQQGQVSELGQRQQAQTNQQQNEQRRQYITELLARRQIPLNEITALMSGSQVSNPFATAGQAGGGSAPNIAPAPIFGAAGQQAAWDQNAYGQQVATSNQQQSAAAQAMMSYFMMASDERLKSNVKRVGTHPLGIGIYEYDIFGKRERGVMAQELRRVKPEAVGEMEGGYLGVYYDMIGGRP